MYFSIAAINYGFRWIAVVFCILGDLPSFAIAQIQTTNMENPIIITVNCCHNTTNNG